MTILEILKTSTLDRLETELLLAFLLKKDREFVLTHPETKLKPAIYNKFRELSKKRLANWPLAYLIDSKEFYGLNFKVSQSVLVPRPETELIVDKVLETAKSNNLIIDLGAGSGAIIIALANKLKIKAEFIAVDISKSALAIARQNAKLNQAARKIKFYQGNLLTPIIKQLANRDLIITANLPYLTKKQIKQSPSISREPKLALDGGVAGLKYYRELFQQLQKINYKSLQLLLEIDPGQVGKIKVLTKKYFPWAALEVRKDLRHLNRLIIIKAN